MEHFFINLKGILLQNVPNILFNFPSHPYSLPSGSSNRFTLMASEASVLNFGRNVVPLFQFCDKTVKSNFSP